MFDKLPQSVIRFVSALGQKWAWLGRKINRYAINNLCSVARRRPHPWSTVHDYTSWRALTDLTWSARHLPAYRNWPANRPSEKDVVRLFQRAPGTPQQLCPKSTLLFPAFAQYLTDGFARTRMPNTSAGESDQLRRRNTSNHQLDMCPLYGRTHEQTLALRDPNRRGRLKSQMLLTSNGMEEFAPFLYDPSGTAVKREFAALDPMLGIDNLPPAQIVKLFAFGGDRANGVVHVSMLNTLFLREHNRLAAELEQRNPDWDDDRVFETARNIVIVLFVKIVVEEYINHISPHLQFSVVPDIAWHASWNKPNWVTAEFSLLYRWHSLIPETVTWGGKPMPVQATFMNNDLLINTGLAPAFEEVSSQPAARLGPFNSAPPLIPIEESGVMQGRLLDLAPYGHYRRYVGLKDPKTFADVSSDPKVIQFLSSVYRKPEDIDFYIGIFAESPEKNSPLPPLILRMVGLDAFSQAFTNPLLSEYVYHSGTFSEYGWSTIGATHSLEDILERNSSGVSAKGRVRMTRPTWRSS
jgi:Animal haem peroxidase